MEKSGIDVNLNTSSRPFKISRYKDIFFVDSIAFHARTLETAEVSFELQNSVLPITYLMDQGPDQLLASASDEILYELESWESESLQLSGPLTNDSAITGQLAESQSKPEVQSLTINVTQICNLHCNYCAAGNDGTYGDPLKKADLLKVIPQMKILFSSRNRGKKFHLTFLGGEPLLYPEGLAKICEYAYAAAIENDFILTLKVTTNGTVFSERIREILQQFQIGVVISCDGPPEVQNKFRPSKSSKTSSEMIEATVQSLMQSREHIPFIGAHAVCHPAASNLVESHSYFKKLGFDWMEFTFDVAAQDLDGQKDYLQSLAELAAKVYKKEGFTGLRKIKNFSYIFDRLESQTPVTNHCGIGKNFLMMDARGDLYPCPWLVGDKNWKVESIEDEKLNHLQPSLIEVHSCQTCWARGLCGGGCHFIHGGHLAPQSNQENGIQKSKAYCERVRTTAALAIHYFGISQKEEVIR